MKSNIKLMTDELHKAFDLANKQYFNNKLPLPAITIQSAGNRKLAMGWCTTSEVWGDKEGDHKLYEINLSAEYIDVSFTETMDTLMHEMVHLYNLVNGIQDVSRNGTYHNKRFLERAKKSGFVYNHPSPDKTYGFSDVRLSDATVATLKEWPINHDIFSIGRKHHHYYANLEDGQEPERAAQQTKKIKTTYKWSCPSCNLIMRSTKPDVNVICGECNESLLGEDTNNN